MIFERSIYKQKNIFKRVFNRISLSLKMEQSQTDLVSSEFSVIKTRLPYDETSLNSQCFLNAFSKNKNIVSVDMGVCNLCGDCTSLDGVYVSKISFRELQSFNYLVPIQEVDSKKSQNSQS